MANSRPTFCCVAWPNRAAPFEIETERNDRLAGLLVERRLRVGEVFARNDDAILDKVRYRRIVRRVHHRRAGGGPARDCFLHGNALVDHLECQLGGLAENFLQPLRILQSRHLNQDAIGALTLDDRLGGAEFINTAADHLDRLGQSGTDTIVEAGIGERVAQQPLLRLVAAHFGHRAAAEHPGRHRLHERSQRFLGLVDLVGLANSDLKGSATARKAGVADLGVAQDRADFVAGNHQPLIDQIVAIDCQKDMGAALEIEAQGH